MNIANSYAGSLGIVKDTANNILAMGRIMSFNSASAELIPNKNGILPIVPCNLPLHLIIHKGSGGTQTAAGVAQTSSAHSLRIRITHPLKK